MKIYSNKKRPVKASSNGRKWVNTELTQDEYAKFRNFLKKKGYKYETSGAGDMVHIEAYLNEAEIKEADNFLDTLDNVNGACGKKSVNASETSVTAAIDDGMHIIIDSKAYVDVTEDDFEQGEVGPYVNSWEFDVRGEYNSIGELVRAISENSYVFSEDVGDYYYMDGSIRTSATVDVDNSKPTDAQIDAWQRGEEKLYVADMYLDIKVGTVHEMTEDEARDFGISLY